jgi:hypothetical protein
VTVNITAKDKWPALEFHQLGAEVGPPPERRFEIAFVPPLSKGWLSRQENREDGSIQLARYKELQLSPGKTLNLDIEPPSDADATRLRRDISDFPGMQRRFGDVAAEEDGNAKLTPPIDHVLPDVPIPRR